MHHTVQNCEFSVGPRAAQHALLPDVQPDSLTHQQHKPVMFAFHFYRMSVNKAAEKGGKALPCRMKLKK